MASATATPPADPTSRRERARTFLSRISIRLLAFNVLLVFLPAAGLLTLGTYERQLLRAQEQAMVQQGRLLAAALSSPDGLDVARADAILKDLQRRQQARLRVVDTAGRLVADSSRLTEQSSAGGRSLVVGRQASVEADASSRDPLKSYRRPTTDDRRLAEGERPPTTDARRPAEGDQRPADAAAGVPDTWLYRIGALPFRVYRFVAEPVQPGLESGEFYSSREQLLGPEIDAALHGRYGAATRISGGQRSVTLYAAIPIRAGHRVTGVVLVSQSTYGILQALYAVRIDVFKVVLASVAAAAVLSLLVSATIAWPLRYLRDQALALVDRRGRLQGGFRGSTTRDEIGDLTRALAQLTARLRDHMSFVESFAADVSHEFKNPLASIRTATELLPSVEDPEQRRRFLQIVQREVARMERLLAGVREISRIDAQLDDDAPQAVDLAGLLESIVEGYRLRVRQGVGFDFAKPDGVLVVRAVPDRLTQVFENLLDNALGFSPPGGTVRVALSGEPRTALVSVADEGPGVPPEHLEKVFARFFSYRPGRPSSNGHAGLGLPIARAIVEGYGGTIEAANGAEGGARFVVRLPL